MLISFLTWISELLNDDFVTGTKIKVSSKTADGLTLTTTTSFSPEYNEPSSAGSKISSEDRGGSPNDSSTANEGTDGATTTEGSSNAGTTSDSKPSSNTSKSETQSSPVKGELTAKACIRDAVPGRVHDFTVNAKLPTNAMPEGELCFERTDQTGRQFCLKLNGSDGMAVTTAEFFQPKLTLGIKADFMKRTVDASGTAFVTAVGKNGSLAFGARGIFDAASGSVSASAVSASVHDGLKNEVTVEVKGKAEETEFAYSHLLRPGLTIAGMMDYVQDSNKFGGKLGISAKVDDSITVKGKVDREGNTGVSFIQTINPNAKVIMSAAFNITQPDIPKVGLSVTLG